MTAIALAESGGETSAHNPNNEDSRGLWQINLEAHAGSEWARGLDMYNPRDNAIAAWHVSQMGADIGPWTVTHGDRGSRYVQFAEEARAAAASQGEPANGNFNGPQNYNSADVPAGAPGGDPFDGALPEMPDSPDVPTSFPPGDGSVQRFLEAALAQEGDTYVFDAQADHGDVDPEQFDCSELVEWAAAQAGVDNVAEASYLQYLQFKEAGTAHPGRAGDQHSGRGAVPVPARARPGGAAPGRLARRDQPRRRPHVRGDEPRRRDRLQHRRRGSWLQLCRPDPRPQLRRRPGRNPATADAGAGSRPAHPARAGGRARRGDRHRSGRPSRLLRDQVLAQPGATGHRRGRNHGRVRADRRSAPGRTGPTPISTR